MQTDIMQLTGTLVRLSYFISPGQVHLFDQIVDRHTDGVNTPEQARLLIHALGSPYDARGPQPLNCITPPVLKEVTRMVGVNLSPNQMAQVNGLVSALATINIATFDDLYEFMAKMRTRAVNKLGFRTDLRVQLGFVERAGFLDFLNGHTHDEEDSRMLSEAADAARKNRQSSLDTGRINTSRLPMPRL